MTKPSVWSLIWLPQAQSQTKSTMNSNELDWNQQVIGQRLFRGLRKEWTELKKLCPGSSPQGKQSSTIPGNACQLANACTLSNVKLWALAFQDMGSGRSRELLGDSEETEEITVHRDIVMVWI